MAQTALYEHTYGYDRSGRLLTAKKLQDSASVAEWAFVYDALGRRTSQTQQIAGLAGTYTTGFGYEIDATSAVTMTYPSGRTATHSYDLRFRPIGVSSAADENDPVDVLGSWTFDVGNRPETATIGSATVAGILSSIFDFDALDRVVKIQHVKNGDPTSTTLFHERYADDAAGNRLFTERLHDPGNSEVYQYDNRDRLVAFQRGTLNQAVTPPAVDTPTTSALLNRSQSWNLDANGNWSSTTIERPGGTVTEVRQVNAVNEYTKIGYVPTNHDANGNMLFDGQRAYTYDAQNRAVSIYNVCSQGITEFAYGPLGEQITETKNGVTTYRIYVGTDVIAEYQSDGSRLREFVDGPGGKLALVDYTSAGAAATGDPEVFFYLIGHLGSIVALTDASGNVVERYADEPYGQTIITDPSGGSRAASAYGNPYAWTGQRYDSENQLYHFYFRTYSQQLGRWLQRDPLEYLNGVSLYEYVSSRPIRSIDLLGLAEWDMPGRSGGFLGNPYVGPRFLEMQLEQAANEEHRQWMRERDERTAASTAAFQKLANVALAVPLVIADVVTSVVPGVSDLRDAAEVGSGYDLIWGDELSTGDRAVTATAAVAPIVGGSIVRKIKKVAEKVVDAVKGTKDAERAADAIPKGGAYLLVDPETGDIIRSGRTIDLKSRRGDHRRHPDTRGLEFEPKYFTDDYAEQRGLEQVLHDQHHPPMNKRKPIDPKNPNREKYMDAANEHIKKNGYQ